MGSPWKAGSREKHHPVSVCRGSLSLCAESRKWVIRMATNANPHQILLQIDCTMSDLQTFAPTNPSAKSAFPFPAQRQERARQVEGCERFSLVSGIWSVALVLEHPDSLFGTQLPDTFPGTLSPSCVGCEFTLSLLFPDSCCEHTPGCLFPCSFLHWTRGSLRTRAVAVLALRPGDPHRAWPDTCLINAFWWIRAL